MMVVSDLLGWITVLAWTGFLLAPFMVYMALKYRKEHHKKVMFAVGGWVFVLLLMSPIVLTSMQRDLRVDISHPSDAAYILQTNSAMIDGLKKVEFGMSRPHFYVKRTNASGIYYPLLREIQMKSGSGISTWYHELGHHVWYHHFNSDQRARWNLLWLAGNHPTEYAETDVEEDFADSFTIFALDEAAPLIGERYALMQKLLKETFNCGEPHCIYTDVPEEYVQYGPIFIKIES